jgi:hypothetical protein
MAIEALPSIMLRESIEKARYWLAWKVMPVDKELIEKSIVDEVPDSFPEEYSTLGEAAYLIGLTEDNWFEEKRKP